MALDIFYENKALGTVAAEVCVDWQVVAGIAGDEILWANSRLGEHLQVVS